MRVVILGCGTSTGVPIIECNCTTCTSKDPRNKRTRTSILVETQGKSILIDTATDLRFQALTYGINRIDAVLYTHSHADHIHGIDELRVFSFIQKEIIPCYGSHETIAYIKRGFKYLLDGSYGETGRPLVELFTTRDNFQLFGIDIVPVKIYHGDSIIFGYRIGKMAYLTDCSRIPDYSKEKLEGLDLLILSALRYKPHPTHLTVEESIKAIKEIRPKFALLTHMGHEIEYRELSRKLSKGIALAFDGMEIELDEI